MYMLKCSRTLKKVWNSCSSPTLRCLLMFAGVFLIEVTNMFAFFRLDDLTRVLNFVQNNSSNNQRPAVDVR